MDNERNQILVTGVTTNNGLQISPQNINQTISATNNKAQYYAEQAKKYKDEAKDMRDLAQYYAEQNSDVTVGYINGIKTALETEIDTKQDVGDYVLSSDLPTKVSDLTNDRGFITDSYHDSTKQDTLVSGTNIKTINSNSILGSGNLDVADTDLSNLSVTGEARFTDKVNISASNLNTQGKSLISGLGMPSSRYTNLTLGASGTTYTAPANGWLVFAKTNNSTNQSIVLEDFTNGMQSGLITPNSGATGRIHIPVKKDDEIQVRYTAAGTTELFRFIYAEGEPSS